MVAHDKEAALVASLPKDIAKLLAPALGPKASPKQASKRFVDALRALEYPVDDTFVVGKLTELDDGRWRGVMPLPTELTPGQRAVAELLAHRDDVGLYYFEDGDWQKFRIPETAANRRRWLGIDPPGPLEESVTITLERKKSTEPAWHALQRAVQRGVAGAKEVFRSLSVTSRLSVLGGLVPMSYGLSDLVEWVHEFFTPDGIGKEHAAWAREQAERLSKIPPSEARRLRFVVFVALVRAKVRIEERHHAIFPFEPNPNRREAYVGIIRECLEAIPKARREAAVMASLATEAPETRGAICWTMLEDMPYAGVARTALEGANAQSLPKLLARLEALAATHPDVRGVLNGYQTARSKKAPTPALACGSALEPTSPSELTPTQRKQLEAFGTAYDGRKLSAKERLSPKFGVEEGSVKGFLEIVEIVDKAKGKRLYDAFLAIDSGSIFEAGSTREVAAFIQGSLDACKDPELFEALKKAFAARPRRVKPARRAKPKR